MFDFIERLKSWADALDIDFCRWRYYAMGVSGALVVASVVLFVVVGPNYTTDFTGGTEIHLKFDQPMPIGDLRSGLTKLGLPDDSVQAVNGSDSGEFAIRIGDPRFGLDGLDAEVRSALTKLYGEGWITNMVGMAEVSARFVVDYKGEYKDYAQIGREIRPFFPNATTAPGKEENQVAIDIPGLDDRIQQKIATEFAGHSFKVLAVDSVGPRVGAELRQQAFLALAATMGLILVYVAFRFDMEFAPGAVIAIAHDVILTVGVFTVFQLDFSIQTIGALLTILGYSINDTIVIYDRIRENRDRYRRTDILTLINKSVSETLARTLTTNFTVFLAIAAFVIWGGPVLRDFAIAMLCGQIFGTYSTIYIASPLIIIFQDLKPYFSKLLAVSDLETDEPTAPMGPEGDDSAPTLTESEKRRRSRADAAREQIG
ncbi:MAG: protein translocase subunit SecF [Myxococcota bacterium]